MVGLSAIGNNNYYLANLIRIIFCANENIASVRFSRALELKRRKKNGTATLCELGCSSNEMNIILYAGPLPNVRDQVSLSDNNSPQLNQSSSPDRPMP